MLPCEQDQPKLFSPSPAIAAAAVAFKANPTKCWQRHIREAYAAIENVPQLQTLDGTTVERISKVQAASFIMRNEWMGSMPSFVLDCYGLKLGRKLLGVTVFAAGSGSPESLRITNSPAKTVVLARGACVHYAPKDAGSFLTRHVCRKAYLDHGWEVFIAYSDPAAGEIGTVYQAVGWYYIGQPPQGIKKAFTSPSGRTLSSYALQDERLLALGWNGQQSKRAFLRECGWSETEQTIKGKWLWFEGGPRRKRFLKSDCRFEFLPYPKRETEKTVEQDQDTDTHTNTQDCTD
jgi:hypothetical protein